MRLKKLSLAPCEPNMTPMIDIVFLLITFFTLVINFSQSESNDRIHLPASELAQPPEEMPAEPMTIQISEDGQIFVGQAVCYLDQPGRPKGEGRPLSDFFTEELRVRKTIDKVEPGDLTIIIRADADTETGFVERVIQACQAKGMENFTLRARQVVD
ncbi:MAG: biopolymer transporter ExbD [Thermoguttaceae bacterium]|nr:biopolymer transporter ExbD [Thermoguttaceae bacterium]